MGKCSAYLFWHFLLAQTNWPWPVTTSGSVRQRSPNWLSRYLIKVGAVK